VTIPDIQHEYYPDFFSDEELHLRKSYIQPTCEMATEIITISKYSKNCLIEKIKVDPEKIHVIYLAAGDLFVNPPLRSNHVKDTYGLPENYLFYPANGWVHKNHLRLIQAFYIFRKTYDKEIHLVLTGSMLKDNKTIQDQISLYQLQESVHILDYISSEDMPEMYRNAHSLIYPSLFEGFGIPLIEAMYMGCPIMASNNTSIPEVVTDAAVFFDPKNVRSIVDAMYTITNDEDIRNKNIQKGKKISSQFSYLKVGQKHLELFSLAASKKW
jgi:glycosyltransferase involved in cell wall biosynthesis